MDEEGTHSDSGEKSWQMPGAMFAVPKGHKIADCSLNLNLKEGACECEEEEEEDTIRITSRRATPGTHRQRRTNRTRKASSTARNTRE